jgi:hypothetical protein
MKQVDDKDGDEGEYGEHNSHTEVVIPSTDVIGGSVPVQVDPPVKVKKRRYGRKKLKRSGVNNKKYGKLTPEARAIYDQGGKAWMAYVRSKRTVFRTGVPDGMRREEADAIWAQAREKASYIMDKLEEAGVVAFNPDVPEDVMAREALKGAFAMAMGPAPHNSKDKLTAIRTVLEWTKAKPATKTDLRLNSAEAWLSEVVEDYKNDGSDA